MRADTRTHALALFAAGVGTGIAISLLLAPCSGPATRRLIVRKVEDTENWLRGKAADATDYVHTQAAEVRDRVKEVAEVIGRS